MKFKVSKKELKVLNGILEEKYNNGDTPDPKSSDIGFKFFKTHIGTKIIAIDRQDDLEYDITDYERW